MGFIQYIIIFIILVLLELIYISIARKFNIGDKVTPRSSHDEFMVSGGGIIFIISSLLFYALYNGKMPHSFNIMLCGASILALISFYDDVKNSAPWLRLIIHIAVVAVLFYQILQNGYYDIFLLLLICGVGFINAFNFMDGINGILAGYTLVTLTTLLYCFSGIDTSQLSNFYSTFISILIVATVVFSIFNCRRNAICFSGDVGAIVMGFFIMYLMSELIFATSNASIIVFLIVYAVDAVFTIFQRLFAGENIFQPHRLHLYQILANQCRISHYKIAVGYALLQLAINVGYLLTREDLRWTYFIVITAVLTIVYFSIKRNLIKKKSTL